MNQPHPATTAATWEWTPEPSAALRRKVAIAAAVVAAVVIGSTIVAAVRPTRFSIVITLLVAGVAGFWWLEHRSFRATSVSLGSDGVLHVGDGRRSSSIDLSTVDSVEVRLRTRSGQGLTAATPKWTIELAGPTDTLVHPIAHAAGLFNPDDDDVDRLRAGLTTHAERRSDGHVGAASVPATSESTIAEPTSTSTTSAHVADGSWLDDPETFEWRPPLSPHAVRRRRRFRIAYGAAAVLVAVLGVTSAWGDWVGVVLSALTVPGLILLFCGVIDWAIGRGRRFVLTVEHGVLQIEPSRKPKRIPLRGAEVSIDRSSQLVSNGTTTTRSTNWILTVIGADETKLAQVLPGLGTVATETDYVALERELRRRT